MITKDYQGNTLPVAYGTVVQGDNRQWLAKLFKNGTELSCAIESIEITKGSCGDSTEFSIGNIISSMLVADLKELTVDVKGSSVEVRIGLDVNGTYSWVSVGTFIIADVKKNLYTTTITGYGNIVSKGGIGFPDQTSPTLAQLGAYIGTELGCTVTLDASIDSTLTIGAPMVGLTTYQALQILANTVGGYAIDTADGNVKVCLYDDTPTHSVSAGLMVDLPDVEEQDFAITGVRVTVSEESYDDDGTIPAVGYESLTPINLLCENPYMTQALFNDMESHIVGYTYRPADIDLTLGDPRIEGNDVLTVTDADNSTYVVPCHMVKHTYTGGFKTEIIAVRPTDSENGIGSLSPMQMKLDSLNSGVVSAQSEAKKAQTIASNTRQHFWFWETIPPGADPDVGTGAHISDVSEDDFNDITNPLYHSGGNLLARSNGIAVRDGLTELATFGANGETIGVTDGTQSYVAMDYHSMQMYDKENALIIAGGGTGEPYFYVSDLRDQSGECQIGDTYRCEANSTGIVIPLTVRAESVVSVTVNDTAIASSTYSLTNYNRSISINYTLSKGDKVVITYITKSEYAKAYTLGIRNTGTVGAMSYAEGYNTVASGGYSHAEGYGTTAEGRTSHAEGRNTQARGYYSHAEGEQADAIGNYSHAEGTQTTASGSCAHAEGNGAEASGDHAHAQNYCTLASSTDQTALGKFNVEDTANTYAVIVGNGTGGGADRSNALTVDWSGNVNIPSGSKYKIGGKDPYFFVIDTYTLSSGAFSITDSRITANTAVFVQEMYTSSLGVKSYHYTVQPLSGVANIYVRTSSGSTATGQVKVCVFFVNA